MEIGFLSGNSTLRNSLSLKVIDLLEKEGATIKAYDPQSIEDARILKPDLEYSCDPYQTVRHADALLILTDWPCFLELDYSQIKQLMASPCVVDARNMLAPDDLKRLGFRYSGIGR